MWHNIGSIANTECKMWECVPLISETRMDFSVILQNWKVQCTLNLVALLASAKTVTKSHIVIKYIVFI